MTLSRSSGSRWPTTCTVGLLTIGRVNFGLGEWNDSRRPAVGLRSLFELREHAEQKSGFHPIPQDRGSRRASVWLPFLDEYHTRPASLTPRPPKHIYFITAA